jgi:thiol:disulfide interchange protein DsbC
MQAKRSRFFLKFLLPVLPLFSLVAGAQTQVATTQETQQLLEKAKSRFGKAEIKSVQKTPIPNIYEIVVENEIVYATPDFSYVITGMILETASGKNLTRERIEQISNVPFASLPLDLSIKVTRGNGAKKLAVFEDPYCGFCRRFEQETLQKLDNVTIYYFMYPILREDSASKAHDILCANDPIKAREDWILREVQPPIAKESCQVDIDKLTALGQKLRIQGTPTTFTEKGSRLSGAVSKSAVEAELK